MKAMTKFMEEGRQFVMSTIASTLARSRRMEVTNHHRRSHLYINHRVTLYTSLLLSK